MHESLNRSHVRVFEQKSCTILSYQLFVCLLIVTPILMSDD